MALLKFILICWISLICVDLSEGAAQNNWYYPNGKLQTVQNSQQQAVQNCGTCPAGYQREAVNSNLQYCGRCVPIDKSCAQGNVLVGNQCQQCPCPGTGERRFGTSCKVDVDGQITCECSNEYSGRDCSQCAPGAVQSNQYPYNCIRINSTNSQNVYCPPGNICNPPPVNQIVNVPQIQPPRVTCPVQQTSCPITNNNGQTSCPVVVPQRPNPWPQPQPQPQPCPVVPLPGPGPILCPTTPVVNPPQVQCPINNGNVQVQCPITAGPCPQCPVQQPCPQIQCPPVQQGPCPPCPAPPQITCPPVNPIQPITCPTVNCPSPCPAIPPIQPCPPCPSNCQQCPTIPACPQCPQMCPPCPETQPCSNCPTPCQPCPEIPSCNNCPNPCQRCPDIPSCPDCKCNCQNTTCPFIPERLQISPCICDPRGTLTQYGSNCMCKANVQGYKCDTCKPGYFALSTDRNEGCLQCWGSGVSSYCSAAVFYRTTIRSSRDSNCSIELTDERNTIVYNRESNSKFSWDGNEARLSLAVATRLFWSLPACFKGNRLTSYGAILRFTRMFTGSGTPLGADNDLMIVGGNGATLIWSSFLSQSSGDWKTVQVRLDEREHWASWKSGTSRLATRFDILEVLADVQMILIRATFTSSTFTASIKDVAMGSVSKYITQEGLVLVIEQARCPFGYQGLSCESCALGFFRDITDMSSSVFGACKLCPCGKNAQGCYISYGVVVCRCKSGFSGDKCQDREVITVTLDPFWIRDCENSEIDFTCSFTTNSKRSLRMRLGPEGESQKAEETKSLSEVYKLSRTLGRIRCEILDNSNTVWASVYAAIQLEPCQMIAVVPPKTINIVLKNEFLCVNESDYVEFSAEVYYYGSRQITPEWRKEGDMGKVIRAGPTLIIQSATERDSGTYIASIADGDALAVAKVVLVVRQFPDLPNYGLLADDPTVLIDGNNKTLANKTETKVINSPKTKSKPPSLLKDSMQKDQPPEGYPSVVVEPSEIIVNPGETVTLRCNASGEEPMKFYWKSGSSDYIPVHVRVSRGALIFKSIRKEDEGSYYCVAWNNLGQVTAKANIIINKKSSTEEKTGSLSVTVPQGNVNATPGKNVYFDCTTNNSSVKPMWSRKSGELPTSSEVKANGTLVLYRVSANDTGIYICKALGAQGQSVQVEASLALLPLVPSVLPSVTLNPKSPVKARSGEKVKVECQASGHPMPNITWSRSIDGSEKKLISTDGNDTSYEITHVTKADEGKYTCTAANEVGSKSESLSLIVDDAIICKQNEFRCKSGDQCVPKEDRCDNERDCNDGSDEHHCRKRSRRALF